MTVQELIDMLQDFDADTEVRVAYQSHYPIRAKIANVTEIEPDEDWTEEENAEDTSFVWIALSDHIGHNESPYAPSAAWSN